MQRFGQCLINEAAISWVDLDKPIQQDSITYRYENGFAVKDKVARENNPAIYIRFVDGSVLTFPVAHPEYAAVRAWLTGEEVPEALPVEAEIMAGLPAELQNLFK